MPPRRRTPPVTQLPPITVDSREPLRIDYELKQEGFEVSRAKLETGDYLWVCRAGLPVVVERKTIADLLSSITGRQANGKSRAQNQVDRLREFPLPVLLIDGYPRLSGGGKIMRGSRETQWTQAGIDNWLLTVQGKGVKVVWAQEERLAERLRHLAQYYEKEKHGG